MAAVVLLTGRKRWLRLAIWLLCLGLINAYGGGHQLALAAKRQRDIQAHNQAALRAMGLGPRESPEVWAARRLKAHDKIARGRAPLREAQRSHRARVEARAQEIAHPHSRLADLSHSLATLTEIVTRLSGDGPEPDAAYARSLLQSLAFQADHFRALVERARPYLDESTLRRLDGLSRILGQLAPQGAIPRLPDRTLAEQRALADAASANIQRAVGDLNRPGRLERGGRPAHPRFAGRSELDGRPKLDVQPPRSLPLRSEPLQPLRSSREALMGLFAQTPSSLMGPALRQAAPSEADVAPGPDVELSANIRALADELEGNPLAIYRYVQDNIAYVPYGGTFQGAEATLLAKEGNDADQAALTIALLRSAGVPARFAHGVVSVPLERLQTLVGYEDPSDALTALNSSGVPAQLILGPEGPESIEMERTWVMAHLPFADYRGLDSGADEGPSTWVALDPAAKVQRVEMGVDLSAAVAFDLNTFIDGPPGKSPLEQVEDGLRDWIAATQTRCETLAQGRVTVNMVPQRAALLPATLPFEVVGTFITAPELPDDLRASAHIELLDGWGLPILDAEFDLSQIAGRPLLLTFDDGPTLYLDNEIVAQGSRGHAEGTEHPLYVTWSLPNLWEEPFAHRAVNGASFALHLSRGAIPDSRVAEAQAKLGELQGSGAPRAQVDAAVAHLAGLRYIQASDRDARTLFSYGGKGQLLLHENLSGSHGEPTYLFGLPNGVDIDGYVIDANVVVGTFPRLADSDVELDRTLVEAAGFNNSFWEHRVWEEVIRANALSTANILQYAAAEGQEILTLASLEDFEVVAGGLTHDTATLQEIERWLELGGVAVVHEHPITRFGRVASGYALMDPANGAGVYRISGGLNGGMSDGGGGEGGGGPCGGTQDIDSWVNISTGALLDKRRLLAYFSPYGMNFIDAAYSSSQDHPSDLGPGWSWSFGDRLFEDQETGDVTRLDAFGTLVRYRRQGEGYSTPRGFHHQLERSQDGWILRTQEGPTFTFDARGLLTARQDGDGLPLTVERDTQGRPTAIKVDSQTPLLTLETNEDGHLTRISNVMGQGAELSYVAGQLSAIEDGIGRRWNYAYQAPARLIGRIDPEGLTIRYGYDSKGRLMRHTNPGGYEGYFLYDPTHRETLWQEPDRGLWLYRYDAQGNILERITPVGNLSTKSYDDAGHLIEEIDARGNVSTWAWREDGYLMAHTRADGAEFTYIRDEDGFMTAREGPEGTITQARSSSPDGTSTLIRTDPDGLVSRVVRDAQGQVTLYEVGDGRIQRYEYNDQGHLIGVNHGPGDVISYTVNEAGFATSMAINNEATPTQIELNPMGQLSTAVLPDGSRVHIEYTPYGDVASLQEGRGDEAPTSLQLIYQGTWQMGAEDGLGRIERLERDGAGALIERRNSLGEVERYERDPEGRVVRHIDPLGAVTELGYCAALGGAPCDIVDTRGNLIQQSLDPLGRVLSVESDLGTWIHRWDEAGRLISTTDALGITTHWTRNSRGEVLSSRVGSASETVYERAPDGRLVSMTEPNGSVTRYIRDSVGRVLGILDPLGQEETWTWGGSGNLQSIVDRKGQLTTFAYDEMGLLSERRYENGDLETYTWQEAALTRATNAHSDLEYIRQDPLQRITRVIEHARNLEMSVTYDPHTGRRATVSRPDGTLHYRYDSHSRLVAITLPGGELIERRYDELGQLSETRYPNGLTQLDRYDRWGRLEARLLIDRSDTLRLGVAYEYDALGRRSAAVDHQGQRTTYSYDDHGRLQSVNGPGEEVSYLYNEAGDRVQENRGGILRTLSWDEAHRLESIDDPAGQITFTYDANGNRLSRTSEGLRTTYTYDQANRLVEIDAEGYPPSVFRYDAEGRRIYRSDSQEEVWTFYDGHHPAVEVDGGLNLVRSYVYADDIDSPLALIDHGDTGQTWFYHTDGLGSVIALSNAEGHLVNRYRYRASGYLEASDEAISNPLTFASRPVDHASGTYDLRARQLDPDTGTFLQADPRGPAGLERQRIDASARLAAHTGAPLTAMLEQPRLMHPYAYGAFDPVNLTDPSGETPDFGGLGLALGLFLAVVEALVSVMVETAPHWVGVIILVTSHVINVSFLILSAIQLGEREDTTGWDAIGTIIGYLIATSFVLMGVSGAKFAWPKYGFTAELSAVYSFIMLSYLLCLTIVVFAIAKEFD